MPLYQFSATDATGSQRRGAIEAPSEADVAERLRQNGLHPVRITLDDAPPQELDPLSPLQTLAPDPLPPPPRVAAPTQRPVAPLRPAAPPAPPRPRRPISLAWINLGVSSLALLLAMVAIMLNLFRDPLGSGLRKYDFTSPKAALLSEVEMRVNRDIRANLELEEKLEGAKLREKLKTLEVRKEGDWKGTTILFFSYEEDGVKKYHTQGFEKDAKSGLWQRKYVNPFDVRNSNSDLADQMESWERHGTLGGPSRPYGDTRPGFNPDRKSDEKDFEKK